MQLATSNITNRQQTALITSSYKNTTSAYDQYGDDQSDRSILVQIHKQFGKHTDPRARSTQLHERKVVSAQTREMHTYYKRKLLIRWRLVKHWTELKSKIMFKAGLPSAVVGRFVSPAVCVVERAQLLELILGIGEPGVIRASGVIWPSTFFQVLLKHPSNHQAR